MTHLTRVLVLSGLVTLVNVHGSVTGQSNHLLAAEAEKAPVGHAITATSDFALDLYGRLAKENPGKNLFFSPYSMSSALAMTAEGARGETAAQMGKVLRFPEAARHVGDDAQLIPWNVELIHTGMAALNGRLNAADNAVPKELREKIDQLRKQLEAANQRAAASKKKEEWTEFQHEAESSQKIAVELNKLLAQVDEFELRVANALWGEKTYPFRQSYLDTINKYYQTGGVFPVDFIGDPEGNRKRINAWVEKQTQERIKDLIPQGAIDGLTRLVLTNAIYFKGQWAEPFSERDTKPDDFTLADGTRLPVPMMHHGWMIMANYAAINSDGTSFDTPKMYSPGKTDEKKLYPDERGFQILELPYRGEKLSMVLIVPRAADGLASLEKMMTAENLHGWIGKLQKRSVHGFVPKFKLETCYLMNETLKAMGMVRAFKLPGPDGAQFDGMCASPDPGYKLYISDVLHKAFVEVNEKGTEAAAATAVLMPGAADHADMAPFTPTFRADKPFIFLIRDRQTGCILFLGRMMSPLVLGGDATNKGNRDGATGAEPAKLKAKSTDPFKFLSRRWISGIPYREAKEQIDPASLPQLHAALKDPAQASLWPAIAVLIGYLGSDEISARAILDYVRRAEDWKGLQEPAHYHRVVCKAQMIMWAGKMGDKHSAAVLRGALAPEGAKELVKEWIDKLPEWGTKDDFILDMIRGYAAEGLVLGQDPEGLQAAEQLYKEVHAAFKQGKVHYKLHYYLIDAMAQRDAIAEMGKEAYLKTVGNEIQGEVLRHYFPKYND